MPELTAKNSVEAKVKMKHILMLWVAITGLGSPGEARAESPPPTGIYTVVSEFLLEGCAEYENSRGVAAHCKKTEKRTYPKGQLLAVDEFFWDDAAKSWAAKVIHLGQNRSIPITAIERAQLPPNACEHLKQAYESILAGIHRGCVKPSDCVMVPMQWNACEPQAAFSKDVRGRYRREDLEQQRRLGHLACQWVTPPCAAVPDELICHNSLCSTVETFYRRSPQGFPMQFIDAKTGALRMNQKVVVKSSGRRTELKSDGLGRVSLPRTLLQERITIEVDGKTTREIENRSRVEILSIPNGQVRL